MEFPAEFRVTTFYPRFAPAIVRPPARGKCFHLSIWGVGIAPTRKPSCPRYRLRTGILSTYPLVQQRVTQVSGERVARLHC